MFFGRGFGVGLTVADLAPPPEFGPPTTSAPALAEVLPVYARTAEEKVAELQRVQQLESELAAYKLELIAAFAATARLSSTAGPVNRAPLPERTRRRTVCRSSSPTSWR